MLMTYSIIYCIICIYDTHVYNTYQFGGSLFCYIGQFILVCIYDINILNKYDINNII